MATIHHSHHRTPSSGHKFVLRPSGTSTHPLITKNHSSGKLASKGKATHAKRKSADADESLADDFDNMAVSFDQYCTTCEKMISVPDHSVLYCSESCRRRDGTIAPPSPPLLSEYEAFTKRPALSRRRLHSTPSAASLPAVEHEGTPDMDPTEWKPDGTRLSAGGGAGASSNSSSTVPRRPSEAFLYLSQFHRSSDSLASSSSRRRSKAQKGVAGAAAAGNAFSLTPAGSNESSTAASPVGSVSTGTAGTAPSINFERASDSDDDEKTMLVGIGFAKKHVVAREEVSGSLGKLLAASVDA